MSLQMIPSNDPILHTPANPVPESYFTDSQENLSVIVDEMWVHLEQQNGLGIAAPQLGMSVQIFLMDFGGRRLCVINPSILKWSGKTERQIEGCLSFPNERVPVDRDTRIKVEYYDETGKRFRHYMSGMQARIFQHEFDHLQGVTIIDRHKEQNDA